MKLARSSPIKPSFFRPAQAALALAVVLTCSSAAAIAEPVQTNESGGPAWATVQKLVQSFKSSAKSTCGSSNVSAGLIDFKQIALRSVGPSQWQKMNSSQRQDLTATIETLVENRYFPRWEKIFGKGDVTYIGQTIRNGDILVSTNLRLGMKDDPLVFQLTASPSRVVSLTVNKNDLLTKLTQRIQAHQAKDGYPAMIAWLKGKGKCDIADGDTTARKKVSTTALKTSSLPGDDIL